MRYFLLSLSTLLIVGCSPSASSVSPQTESKVGEKTEPKVGEKTEPKVGEKTESKVGEKTESKVGEKTESKVGEKTESKVGEKTESKVGEKTEPKVGEKTEPKVGEKTEPNLKQLIKDSISLLKDRSKKEDRSKETYSLLKQIEKLCNKRMKEEEKKLCSDSIYNKLIYESRQKKYPEAVKTFENYCKNFEDYPENFIKKDKNGKINKLVADIYYIHLEDKDKDIDKALNILTTFYNKYNNEENMDLNYSIGALYIEKGSFSESRRYILIAKNLGSIEAENLWYKHELYKY